MPYSSLEEIPKNTGLIVFLFGIIGAIINYGRRKNKSFKQKALLFFSDMVSSVMLSIVTFTTVVGSGGSELLAVGLAGFVSHQGTRAVYLLELIIAKKLNVDIQDDLKTDVKDK